MKMKRSFNRLSVAMMWCVLGLATLWAVAALHFDVRSPSLRTPLAIAYGLGVLAAWVFVRTKWLRPALTAVGFAIVLMWWLMLQPSNDRDWQPDLAVLAHADINGSQVTMHNIRNCDYRSETDFGIRHYDKTFDLDTIRTADLYMVYWGSPNIAHTMMSFGFENGDFVCFSIETRKEKGEGYSAIKGMFRQFELIYIVGDERDLVRLRSNYRKGEDVYLYRLQVQPEQVRTLFMDYVRRVNELWQRPEWYSALTNNCTTSIRTQRAVSDRAPWDWRMLVNGHGNAMLYERGMFDTSLPLDELSRRCLINERAKAADQDAEFSRLIRVGVPGVGP